MRAPYIERPEEAFLLVEVGLGVLLTACVAFRPPTRRLSAALLLIAAWMAVIGPLWSQSWALTGQAVGANAWIWWWARAFLLGALVAHGSPRAALVSLPALALATWSVGWVQESDLELAAFHVQVAAWTYGAMLASRRAPLATGAVVPRRHTKLWHTIACAAVATAAGVCVCRTVLDFKTDSSDEWSYTYQAYLFAKGKAYGAMYACDSMRPFWVIHKDGRLFSIYQPGWPLFMVPFVWMGCVWLAGPASFGFFVAAMHRLARTTVMALPNHTDQEADRAGWVAAALCLCSGVLLLNAGSRYPHLLVLALFTFGLEQSLLLAYAPTGVARTEIKRALLIGFAFGWMLCTRVPDAALMGTGPALLLLLQALRRRIRFHLILVALAPVLTWTFLLFWISKLQTGVWGQLAYQHSAVFYPSSVQFTMSLPPPTLLKWHLSTAWGAYCYWPLSPALGAGGLAWMIARSWRSAGIMLTISFSTVVTLTFYGLLEMGRGNDFGYGPRYQFFILIAVVMGTVVLFNALLRGHRAGSRNAFGWLVGAVSLALAVATGSQVLGSANHNILQVAKIERGAEHARLRNAVVVVQRGTHTYGEQDQHNLPLDLWKQNVVYSNDSDVACVRRAFPNRSFYLAAPKNKTEVRIERMAE